MERQAMRGRRLSKYLDEYVVFDFETTGINVRQDDIIEISAVKVAGHKPVETFSMLVNPGRPIPAAATRVNGITNELVRKEPALSAVLPQFLDFISDKVLVGHNIQTFDMKFLYREAEELLDRNVSNDFIDTLYMARNCLPQLSHHRLTDLAKHFNLSTEGAHRALNDCIMNQLCYEHMGRIMKDSGVPACAKCGCEMVARNGKFGPFYGCSNYPACRHTERIRTPLKEYT